MSLFIKSFNGTLSCKSVIDLGKNCGNLRENISQVGGIPSSEILLTCNGRLVADEDSLKKDCVYYATLKIKGGKGGFGSMLRMLGAQIEKTTNHEACRDLSGRRMRDVNNEKKLAEWVKDKANSEAEREKRRYEKLERRARDPKHVFVDPTYDQQKADVTESLAEAVSKGMEASASTSNGASSSAGPAVKRKTGIEESSTSTKKRCVWMGVEDDSGSDVSDEEDSSDEEAMHQDDSTTASTSTSSGGGDMEEEKKQDGVNERLQDPEAASSSTLTETEGVGVSSSGDDGATTQPEESTPQPDEPVDLEQYTSADDLATLGLERLKAALMIRGLKCGGTLQERAIRLISVKGLSPDEIDSSLKAKPVKGKKKGKK